MVVSWLDLANAFSSIPHEVLIKVLKHCNAGEKAVELVKNIYTGQEVITQAEERNEVQDVKINVTRGVLQGDPMSPILSNLVFELLLKQVEDSDGVEVMGHKISKLDFADESHF